MEIYFDLALYDISNGQNEANRGETAFLSLRETPLKSGKYSCLLVKKRRYSTKGVFSMKNTIKILGIIALVAIIGFSMAACDDGSTDGNDGIEMSFGSVPMLGGSVLVAFDGGAVTSTLGTNLLSTLKQDFTLTIDGAVVNITGVGFRGGSIDLGLDTNSYTDGNTYNISVTYTPNDARPIVYMNNNEPLGAFSKTQNVKFIKI
jgi:hypothetical protein